MTELVERLRELSANMLKLDLDMRLPAGSVDPAEAADRIESLERENAELATKLMHSEARVILARRGALGQAAQIAEREYKRHCTGSGFDSQPARAAAYSILQAIRTLSDTSTSDSRNKS